MNDIDTKLVNSVATLMCCDAATKSQFFYAVTEQMRKRGYIVELHQQGISGTLVKIVKTEN